MALVGSRVDLGTVGVLRPGDEVVDLLQLLLDPLFSLLPEPEGVFGLAHNASLIATLTDPPDEAVLRSLPDAALWEMRTHRRHALVHVLRRRLRAGLKRKFSNGLIGLSDYIKQSIGPRAALRAASRLSARYVCSITVTVKSAGSRPASRSAAW